MRRQLPVGTVTFLFTDVEASTRLLQELGDRYPEVLHEHRKALREAFERHGGVEVDTQGDAFFVAFAKASEALAAAREGRDALEAGPIRVRIGLHTGEPVVTEEGYVGIDVHRAARIAAAGHGGQILVSQSTRDLTGTDGLRDLGEHRLRDLTAPERIYQLGDGDFPPLKSLNQTNLPVQPTPLVGREREVDDVLRLLHSSRLLTVTGPGGSGKTRLALHAAAELVEEFVDGVWFVSLAAVTDAELVPAAIATTLGAKEDVVGFLRPKRLLLLLDNLEQLLPEVALSIAKLLDAPNVKVLTTSRERLAVSSEQEYAVPPLPRDEAIALFTARVRQLKPRFDPDEHVAAIAQRLDGLPLALELAAARAKVLTTEQILERLGHGLDLLTAGARDVPDRQRTLRATIEWSYDLLDHEEQRSFASLAVFAPTFTLEAAAEVCDVDVDVLGALVEKSLLRQTEDGRFFMLETIREFAKERLADAEDLRLSVEDAHARFFLKTIAAISPYMPAPAEIVWLNRERDNLYLALAQLDRAGDAQGLATVAARLGYFWFNHGLLDEGLSWLERAWKCADRVDPEGRRGILAALTNLCRLGSDHQTALRWAELELEAAEESGLSEAIAFAYGDLGAAYIENGEFDRAIELQERSAAVSESAGDRVGAARARAQMGMALARLGDHRRAAEILETVVPTLLEVGLGDWGAFAAVVFANVLRRIGRHDEAERQLALALGAAPGAISGDSASDAFIECASIALERGAYDRAACLVGAAGAHRPPPATIDPLFADVHQSVMSSLRVALDPLELDAGMQRGAGLDLEAAVALARSGSALAS